MCLGTWRSPSRCWFIAAYPVFLMHATSLSISAVSQVKEFEALVFCSHDERERCCLSCCFLMPLQHAVSQFHMHRRSRARKYLYHTGSLVCDVQAHRRHGDARIRRFARRLPSYTGRLTCHGQPLLRFFLFRRVTALSFATGRENGTNTKHKDAANREHDPDHARDFQFTRRY